MVINPTMDLPIYHYVFYMQETSPLENGEVSA
jgi:hypothetical protein